MRLAGFASWLLAATLATGGCVLGGPDKPYVAEALIQGDGRFAEPAAFAARTLWLGGDLSAALALQPLLVHAEPRALVEARFEKTLRALGQALRQAYAGKGAEGAESAESDVASVRALAAPGQEASFLAALHAAPALDARMVAALAKRYPGKDFVAAAFTKEGQDVTRRVLPSRQRVEARAATDLALVVEVWDMRAGLRLHRTEARAREERVAWHDRDRKAEAREDGPVVQVLKGMAFLGGNWQASELRDEDLARGAYATVYPAPDPFPTGPMRASLLAQTVAAMKGAAADPAP